MRILTQVSSQRKRLLCSQVDRPIMIHNYENNSHKDRLKILVGFIPINKKCILIQMLKYEHEHIFTFFFLTFEDINMYIDATFHKATLFSYYASGYVQSNKTASHPVPGLV